VPTAADLEGQKVGAKTGQDYAADITAKAADAMAGKRTLSEMDNLLQGFTPGAGCAAADEARCRRASHGRRSGHGAEAHEHQPRAMQKPSRRARLRWLAKRPNRSPNRVTQTESRYSRQQSNWMMTPNGIKRVMDFMGKGFDQQIDMQQQFASWSKGAPPDRWGIDFPAEYNKRQLAAINAGQTIQCVRVRIDKDFNGHREVTRCVRVGREQSRVLKLPRNEVRRP